MNKTDEDALIHAAREYERKRCVALLQAFADMLTTQAIGKANPAEKEFMLGVIDQGVVNCIKILEGDMS